MTILAEGVTMQDEELEAADRLILGEAAGLIAGASVVVVGSTLLAEAALDAGAASVRVHVDAATGGRAAEATGDRAAASQSDRRRRGLTNEQLGPALFADTTLVLLRLPKSLDALDQIARLVAANASPDVTVVAGARLKYMSLGMNEVLRRSFGQLDVSLARWKSRVLTARRPLAVELAAPRRVHHSELDLWVVATGGVFAGSSIDIGTRAMLSHFDQLPEFETAIDFGCGTGILASVLKRTRPAARVIATDVSAAAAASATMTAEANGLDIEVVREAGLASQPDASADLIVLNPPFHDGGPITRDLALGMFAEAGRVLRPGGQLWTVWNSHLRYRSALTNLVGPTAVVARTPKFTVTATTHSSDRLSPTNSAAH
jgi:16S rRNA (guanine1207-N2)-methyltransferase